MRTMNVKQALATVRKAIVAAATVAAIQVLHKLGIEIDQEAVAVIVDAIIVSTAVWAIPNVQKDDI